MGKNRFLWVVLAALFFGFLTSCDMDDMFDDDRRGSSHNVAQNVTVAQAKGLWDDTRVILQGTIEGYYGYRSEIYSLSDGTGSITVEIDHEELWYLSESPESIVGKRVEIRGDIDWEHGNVKVDVDRITLL